MDRDLHKRNRKLLDYIDTLQNESKFKAKVLYTLSCLNSYLQASPASQYGQNIKTLASFHDKLLEVAHLHPDWSILACLISIYCKFQKFGITNISEGFLEKLLTIDAEGQVSDQFVNSLGTILILLKHKYRKIKQICMQLLFQKRIKIRKQLGVKILKYMINLSRITIQQCIRLSQLQFISPQILIHLMLSLVIQSTPTQAQIAGIDKALIRYLDRYWQNQYIIYLCLCVSIVIAVYSSSEVDTNSVQLRVKYLNNYLYNNPKPFYMTYTELPNQANMDILFRNIIKHYGIQISYLCSGNNVNSNNSSISIIKTIESIIPKLQAGSQQHQLLSCVVQNSKIPNNIISKYMDHIPIQLVSSTNPIPLQHINTKLTKQYNQNKDNLRVIFVTIHKLWQLLGSGTNNKNSPIWFDLNATKQLQMLFRLLLPLLQTFLLNKHRKYLNSVEELVKIVIKKTLVMPNSYTIFQNLINQNINYTLYLFIIIQLKLFQKLPAPQKQKFMKNIQKYIGIQNIPLQFKFYCCYRLIKSNPKGYSNIVKKFSYFLLRKLEDQKESFQELAYYMRNYEWTQSQIAWIYSNFEQETERILEKVMAKLADAEFKAPKLIVYTLQKYNTFNQWRSIHRWSLNPLDQISYSQPQCLIDSLQVFQTIVQDCKHVPIQVIKRFFSIVAKNWEKYNHHHMFTIQRITRLLFSEQQLSAAALQQVTWHIKSLTQRNWQVSNPELYKQSLSIMIKNTLMQQTQQLDATLQKLIFNQILSVPLDNLQSQNKNPTSSINNLGNYWLLQTKIFAQQLLLWRFQYEQAPIIDKVGQMLIKIINSLNKLQRQIINPQDLELLIQNSLQIISSVAHNCNLLQLQLSKILAAYIRNHNIIEFIIEIVCNIKQINMRAISKFKFEKVVAAMFTRMLVEVSDRDGENIDIKYVEFISELCGSSDSPYNALLVKNVQLMKEIIRTECVFITNRYRPNIIKFILEQILDLGKKNIVPKKWIQIIWLKYFDNDDIRSLCYKFYNEISERQKSMKSQKIQVSYEPAFMGDQGYTKKQSQGKSLKQTPKIQQNSNLQQKKNNQGQKKVQSINQQPKKVKSQQKELVFPDEHKQDPQVTQIQETQQIKQPLQKEDENSSPIKSSNRKDFNLEVKQQNPTDNATFKTFEQPKMSNKQKENPFSNKTSKTNNNKNDSGAKKKKTSKNTQQQSQNISNIKNSIAFIGSLADVQVDQAQLKKLQQSLQYITEVVCFHQYYCQKVINFGVINKCLALHQRTQALVVQKILDLFVQISQNKQKNSLVFNDPKAIDFFKRELKQSINNRKQSPANSKIIGIVERCWNSSNDFFANGLLSMFFQMAKINLNIQETLTMLNKCQLSYGIVNQIYQRGLFNLMQTTLQIKNNALTEKDKRLICLWVRLMGKVCLNQSIREKMFSMKLHQLSFFKLQVFIDKDCLQNLAFLYASFTYQFEKISIWAIQKQLPEFFLARIQAYDDAIPPQYYKFFRYFSQNGQSYIEHLFRIKFHNHLLNILPFVKQKVKSEGFKHYYKCFSHLFVPKYYEIFIKSQLIFSLVKSYQEGHNYHILECLQRLINQINDKKQLQVLQKQNFYEIQCVFNSKVKDDLSYPYILQIYLNLLRKFKKFDSKHLNYDFANIVLRKGIYSINMEGKRKTIQFLVQFSQIDKICYVNANCLNIFQSIFGYSIGQQELNLLLKFLKIQFKYQLPKRKNEQQRMEQQEKYPLRFKYMSRTPAQNLLQILLSKVQQVNKQYESQGSVSQQKSKIVNKIGECLSYFLMSEQNCNYIFDKLGLILMKNKNSMFTYEQNIRILNRMLYWKQIQKKFKRFQGQIYSFIESACSYYNYSKQTDNQKIQILIDLLQKCLKNGVISKNKLQKFCNQNLQKSKFKNMQKVRKFIKLCNQYQNLQQINETTKTAMKAGVKVKMYKNDGSNSNLVLHFTDDLFELNCVTSLGETAKNKWKLFLNQITNIQEYNNQQSFKSSVFYMSSGLFTKAPPPENCLCLHGKSKDFYICFENTAQLLQWKKFVELAKSRASDIISKIS